MHEMSASLSHWITQICFANMAEWMKVLLKVDTVREPGNIVLDGTSCHGFDVAFANSPWPLDLLVVNGHCGHYVMIWLYLGTSCSRI